MLLIDQIAEQHIRTAQARGEFDNLPGRGNPLHLDDDRHVPPHLRVGYRLLKNANYLPPELELRKQIRQVKDLLPTLENEGDRVRAHSRLALLRIQLTRAGNESHILLNERQYQQKLNQRW